MPKPESLYDIPPGCICYGDGLMGMECTATEHARLRVPGRIQRKRTLGWRKPPNTICVTRPSKWGNPYWDIKRYGIDLCLKLFRETANGCWNPLLIPDGPMSEQWHKWLYAEHRAWLNRIGRLPVETIRYELRGKNLACYCPLDQPCHADILLEIANG